MGVTYGCLYCIRENVDKFWNPFCGGHNVLWMFVVEEKYR